MKWLRNYVERKRPDLIENLGYAWQLLSCRWFGIGIVMRYRSDTWFNNRNEANRLILVLDGTYLDHYEIPRTGNNEPARRVPKGAYVYGNQRGLWACVTRNRGALVYKRAGARSGLELLSPRNTDDKIIDFAKWMRHEEVVFDAERPVILLMLTWGGVWR